MVNVLIKKPFLMGWAMVFLVGSLLSIPALGHNVLGGVYAIGSTIEGEAGFSNGDMAKAGTPVLIQTREGRKLGATTTDAEGFFSFEARENVDHHFVIDMSAGHLLKLVLPADELPANLSAQTPQQGSDSAQQASVSTTANAASVTANTESTSQVNLYAPANGINNLNSAVIRPDELQAMIEQAVARQVKPLRQELAAYKEKAGFQDILGGIGYIFGLCGLGIWWQQRKQKKQAQAALHNDDTVKDHA